jgi:PIN domain nuclease of toxin-antitoxin system
MNYISDTHPLVWLLTGSSQLSQAARDAFNDATSRIIVPAIVLAEIKHLYARGRIAVDVSDALSLVASKPNCVTHPLDEAVVDRLPTSLDIHDAILVATALVYQDSLREPVALITRDAAITASGLVAVLW